MNKTELTLFIKEYESDTFSASGREISRNEARKCASKLIDWWLSKLVDRIDGVLLTEHLDDVRYASGNKCSSCDKESRQPFKNTPFDNPNDKICDDCLKL